MTSNYRGLDFETDAELRKARDAICRGSKRDRDMPLEEFARMRTDDLRLRWVEIGALARAAREAVAAYEARFESISGKGNYTGPIDEEMAALKKALRHSSS